MAAFQEADISEEKEIVLTSETEQKIPVVTSQSLEITAASGQEKQTPAIQNLESTFRESRPSEPRKSTDGVNIEKLTDLAKSQHEKIKNLQNKIAETMKVLLKEREEKQQLSVKVGQQNQKIEEQTVQVTYFVREMKKNKRDTEKAIAKFSKIELEKKDLNATLRYLTEEGRKINQTLKEERDKNEKQMRKIEQAQNKAGDLQNKVTELNNKKAALQNEVARLKSETAKLQDMNFAQENDIKLYEAVFKETEGRMSSMALEHAEEKLALESELNEYKHSVDEYKLSLEEATALLEKTMKNKKTISERLMTYKARSDRRGKIIQANKETKAEMKENIDTLKKENEKLQADLNSGFIGRYRGMKRFLGRVINALLLPF